MKRDYHLPELEFETLESEDIMFGSGSLDGSEVGNVDSPFGFGTDGSQY